MAEHPSGRSSRVQLGTPRRELLRGSLGALGTLLALDQLMGCADGDDVQRDTVSREPAHREDGDAPAPSSAREDSDAHAPSSVRPAADTRVDAGAGAADGAAVSDAGRAIAPPPRSQAFACPKPIQFPAIVDEAARASFTRADESTTLDWLMITLASAERVLQVPSSVLSLLHALGELRFGYPLTLLEHSLQTATRARRAGASDDLVLCALCHHLGMAFTIPGYTELSAAMLRPYVADDAYRVLRHHGEYEWRQLAGTGAASDPRARYAGEPWHASAERFADEWDRLSYDPSYDTLPLSEFEPLLQDRLSLGANLAWSPSSTCA